jgi:DNA-binding HxlR family transcriptional regulator
MVGTVTDAMSIEQERTFEIPLPADVCGDVSEVLARVGDKWSIRILRHLRTEPVRFNELQRVLGSITHKMLTQTLRGLERDGLVARLVTPTVPPRVDYELTALGRDALAPIDALAEWALNHRAAIHRARHDFDQRSSS